MITVNDTNISPDQVWQEMQYHPAPAQRQAEKAAATTLVIGELLRQRALELGLEPPEPEHKGGENDALEQLIAEDVAYPEATEDECRSYFSNNREKFVTSPLLDVSHILIAGDPADESQRAYAHDIAARLLTQVNEQPGQFARLAEAHSECSSGPAGGSLGQISKGQTVPEFERQVFRADIGLIPSLVETRYGYHVVQVHQKVPGRPLEFDMVRDRIRDYLNERVRRKAVSQYINALMAEARIDGIELDVQRSPLMQ